MSPRALRKIPTTVITGFLGAGKTTLVRHLLEANHGRRIALIINEFGDIGVDREVLRGCGAAVCDDDDIVELANGCLCCTVADEFLPVMERLAARTTPPDHIVIETSGLALPKPLVKAFHWPEIRSRVTVDGVVAVIDAAAVAAGRFADDPTTVGTPDHDNPLDEVFSDQLLCADMVLLNKSDLVPADGLRTLQADLGTRLRAGVKLVTTSHGRVDPAVLLGLDAAAEEDLEVRPSHHDGLDGHDHDDFESFAVSLPPVIDPAVLETRLVEAVAAHDILRIKGFLDVPGKPMRHVVQGVGARFERYYDRPWAADETRRSQLVVIGLKGLDRPGIMSMVGALA
ncbi:MAG: cobalamin biosynthesis protein CobW [Alphaproteobacteria bacterium]